VVFSTAVNPQVNDQLWFTNSFNGVLGNTAYFVVSAPNTSAAVLSLSYSGAPVTDITTGSSLTQAVRINSGQGATLTNAGANAALVIDGVTTLVNYRVLLEAQTNAFENGVYVVSEVGNATTAWSLTRSGDMDTYIPDDINGLDAGDYFYVELGSRAGEAHVMTSPIGPVVIGYDNLTFTQFSASQVYSANTAAGLSLTGTVFSAKVDDNTTAFDLGGNIIVKAGANLTTPNIGAATGTSLSVTGDVTGGNVYTAGVVSAMGNITGGNVSTTGNVTANYFIGNGSQLTGVTAASVDAANLTGNTLSSNVTFSSLTSVGTLSNLSVTGDTTSGNLLTGGVVSAAGTVTGGNLATAGTITATGTATVGNVATGGTVTATGTITGGNLATAGTITATGTATVGNVATGGTVSATGNITGGNIDTAGAVSATGTGTFGNVDTSGTISATGTATVGNLATGGTVSATGTGTFGNVSTAGTVTATGTITGGNIATAGTITATGNVTGGNVLTSGAVSATGTGTFGNVATAGTVTATGTVTGGNVLTAGEVSAGGTLTGGNIVTGGSISAVSTVTGGNLATAGTVTAAGTITGGNIATAGTVSATGTATVGNVLTGGIISATGTITSANTITGGNLATGGSVSATGNIQSGNVLTGGDVSATGTLTGGNITTAGNVTGGNVLFGSGIVSGTGDIYAGNIFGNVSGNIDAAGNNTEIQFNDNGILGASAGFTFNTTGNVLTVDGNVDGANFLTAGTVSATGNITGNFFLGNGSQLTGIDTTLISNGNSNVQVYANSNVAVTVAGTANVAVFTTTGISVTGNVESTSYTLGANAVFGTSLIPVTGATVTVNSTDSVLMPVGNTLQRPGTPATGMLRFNSEVNKLEVYDDNSWEEVGATVFTVIGDDQFAGDGSTVTFTLSSSQTTDSCIVSINGVVQIPTTAYSVAGTTLTFTEAPQPGDDIDVRTITTTTTVTGLSNSPGNAAVSVNDTTNIVFVTGQLSVSGGIIGNTGINTTQIINGSSDVNIATAGGNIVSTVAGNVVQTVSAGAVTIDGDLTVTGNATLSGNILADRIQNGTTSIDIQTTSGNANITVGGVSNVAVFTTTGLDITGNITATGDVTAQNVNSLSDATLKTNVEPIENAGAVIDALEGKGYDWVDGSGHSYGMIAQEVEKIIPEAVKTDANGIKSVNYQMVIPFLVETVKELRQDIAEIKSQLKK